MAYYNTGGSRPRGRGRSKSPYGPPVGGLFAGNKSVKYGLVAVIACMFIAGYFKQFGEQLPGPIDDVFRRNPSSLLVVYGTEGNNTAELREYAHKVARLLGVSLKRDILVYPDREVDSRLIHDSSLLLFGPVDANRISRRLKKYFPFQFDADTLKLGDQAAFTRNWQLVFAVPNPRNNKRYLLVYTGPSDTDVIGINMIEHPNFVRHDTTDYVLAVDGRIELSGFFLKDDSERWTLPR